MAKDDFPHFDPLVLAMISEFNPDTDRIFTRRRGKSKKDHVLVVQMAVTRKTRAIELMIDPKKYIGEK